jgi:geranylgeranyl reductase family protein
MYDLIIVGAGPSGSSAGRRAGKKGLRTLVLEQAKFPRFKACGGAISEQALSYLDFELPASLNERDVFGARVAYGGRTLERHKDYRISILTTRNRFDAHLVERLAEVGVEFRDGQRVRQVEEHSDSVTVTTNTGSERARLVLIAEGSQGRLKHLVRRPDTDSEYGICMVADIPASDAAVDARIHRAIEIHLAVAKRGYGWVFPHEGYFSVGIGGLAKDLPQPRKVLQSFLVANGFDADSKCKGHLTPAGGIKRRITSSRIMLSGDAAGFVDPFIGEGIAYAIRSGQIAAEAAATALETGVVGRALRDYVSHCQGEFGGELRYSLMLSKLMHRYPGFFFRLFCSNPRVFDRFLEVPAVKRTYREYVQWLVPRAPSYFMAEVMRTQEQT